MLFRKHRKHNFLIGNVVPGSHTILELFCGCDRLIWDYFLENKPNQILSPAHNTGRATQKTKFWHRAPTQEEFARIAKSFHDEVMETVLRALEPVMEGRPMLWHCHKEGEFMSSLSYTGARPDPVSLTLCVPYSSILSWSYTRP